MAEIAARVHVEAVLMPGGAVALGSAATHHLRNVLRLAPGAVVAAFNARDGEFLCRIAGLDRHETRLAVEAQRRAPQAEPDLWLLFAPVKRVRLDWLVEKATELGVAALLPVWTRHTQAERLNRDRLIAHAVAASEQSERLSVPVVAAPEPLDRVLAVWPAGRRLIVCDESGGAVPLAAALADEVPPGPAAILVGPEGGFAETELDALSKLPIVTRVGLGPRVLRAETATLAALAVFQAIAGDGRRARLR